MKTLSRNASAVVTGAGSGIGRAVAIEIARRGGRVVCADIDEAGASETVRLIAKASAAPHASAAVAHRCDVAVFDDVVALADAAERWLGGPVNLVVNNAGVGAGGRQIGDIPLDDWQWVLSINLWGVIHGCHVFAPRMRKAGRGGIINVASSAAFAAAPGMGAYNVSKAGVLALSETLAAELSGSGIKVAVVCPTFVKTNIVRSGRGTAQTMEVGDFLMKWTGIPAARVARVSLDALDRGQLHVLPQADARSFWRFKRYAPAAYTTAMGWVGRALRRHEKRSTVP